MKSITKRIINSAVVALFMVCSFFIAANPITTSAKDDFSAIELDTNETYEDLAIAGVSTVLFYNLKDTEETVSIYKVDQYAVGSAMLEANETDIVTSGEIDDSESGDATGDSNDEWYSVEDAELDKYTYVKINVREEPSTDANCIGKINPGEELEVTGIVTDSNWVQINYDGTTAYVCSDYIQDEDFELSTYNYDWTGRKLNSYDGKVAGPSGNETFYNLPMERVVYYMHCLGYDYDYWVRDDGVKMFGPYVMVAADLSIRPKGTIVETTLGTGIVCDTGDFVQYDSTRLDVAVNW